MTLHLGHFFRSQRTCVAQHVVRDTGFADVMQHATDADIFHLARGHAHGLCHDDTECRDIQRMLRGGFVFGLNPCQPYGGVRVTQNTVNTSIDGLLDFAAVNLGAESDFFKQG